MSDTWNAAVLASGNVNLVSGVLAPDKCSGFSQVYDNNGVTPGNVLMVLGQQDQDFGPNVSVVLTPKNKAGAAAGDSTHVQYEVLAPMTTPIDSKGRKVLSVQGTVRLAAGGSTQGRVEFAVHIVQAVPAVGPSSLPLPLASLRTRGL